MSNDIIKAQVADFKRTKIIGTLGPAITGKLWDWKMFNDPKNASIVKDAYTKMEEAILSGLNVVRLNFSHGEYEEQLIRVKIAREVAAKLDVNIGFLLDTKGPEIRVCKMPDDGITYKIGSKVIINTIDKTQGTQEFFCVTDSTGSYNLASDLKIGAIVLVDDGKFQLRVEEIEVNKGLVITTALNTHTIKEKKRINLPGADYSMPFLSEKDINDIKFACDNDFDYIALSFVNKIENVQDVRKIIENHKPGCKIQLVSKIESTQAINNIKGIIKASDGVMVARGDLGLEVAFYDIPYWQKYIQKACRNLGKFCIVATQMLDSLERNIQPTRAEVTDVFFAVDRGADATMLSGETAQGQFPIRSIQTMAAINRSAEKLFDYERSASHYFPKTPFDDETKVSVKSLTRNLLPDGINIRHILPMDFVFMFCDDENYISAISNIKPASTFIIFTTKKDLLRRFHINYCVHMYEIDSENTWAKDPKAFTLKFIESHKNIFNVQRPGIVVKRRVGNKIIDLE